MPSFIPCATTTSMGNGMLTLFCLALCSKSLLASTQLGSNKDVPMLTPSAFNNVLAIPPPVIKQSIFGNKCSSNCILVETFEPPTIAATGGLGECSTL